jgi:hypothetical protein
MSWRVNALKFLIILPFTNYRSKHLWITDTFNISLAQEAAGVSYPGRQARQNQNLIPNLYLRPTQNSIT